MAGGGELRVGGRLLPRREGVRARVQLWVADTGQGIPADELPHIYEPFYSTKTSGTGLGLAVVYRTVQDHAGSIDVRSHPGAGTTFTLELPATPAAA
jgi:signal transduction histidine kinase